MKLKQLHEYLCNLNPYTSPDALLLSALIKISQIAGINNIEVKSSLIDNIDNIAPANIYAITFMESGSGKDKPLRDLDSNILYDIFHDFYDRATRYNEEAARNIERQADEKYGEKISTEKTKFINNNSPRFLILEMSDATLEGFISLRGAYKNARFGGTFVKIGEFGNYITTDNQHRMEFLSIVSEVFDYGDSNPKVIKTERNTTPITNVPSTAMFHTSTAGLLEGKNREMLFSFLNRGLSRRSFICYPTVDNPIQDMSVDQAYEKIQADRKKARETVDLVKEDFDLLYEHTRKPDNVANHDGNTFTYTADADLLIEKYHVANKIEAAKMGKDTDKDGVRSDLASRHWKTLKLAGLIAAYEHPEKLTVEIADVEEAIRITNKYSKHLAKFYAATPTAGYKKLYQYLMERKGTWNSKMDFREARFVDHRQFSRWFDDALPATEELLESQGYILQQEKVGRSGMKYRVMPVTQDPEDEPEEKKITISVGDTNKPTETHFKLTSLKFDKMHKITALNRSWCATTFKDDYRKDESATGNIDLVVFDVDSGMDMKDCIENLKSRKIKSLVTTTRSHQKKKDDKPACDRYRVILPLQKTETLSTEDYKMKITQAALSLGIPNDRATKNISRLWFGNPDQEYTYIDGGCIDLSVFKKPIYEPKADLGGKYNGSDNSGIKRWFADNWQRYGGRNNTLYIVKQFFMNDKQMDIESVKQAVLEVNDLMGDSIPVKEIEQTVFKSLKTPSVPLPEEEAEVTVDDLPF